MKVSIIIPTYNEADVISSCLSSLNQQSYKDFEVIIVDDGSTDGTLQILRAASDIKVYSQNHQGPAMARNLGAKHAKGEILVFIDSDMTFDKKFITMLIRPIVNGQSKGTWSRDEYVSNWENKWARCWNINLGWEKKRRHPKRYPKTQKVFRAILKSEFDSVRGFDRGGYTDDWTLSQKLGYEATLADKAVFYHKNPSTLKEIYRHAKWVSKRKYKLGIIGVGIVLVRYSLPFSLLIGVAKAVRHKEPSFLIFKIVYDFGAIRGLIEYVFRKNGEK